MIEQENLKLEFAYRMIEATNSLGSIRLAVFGGKSNKITDSY